MKLAGKRAVITGASLGLGRAIAELFAKEGADLLICARNAQDLEVARHEILAEASVKVVAQAANIACEADVQRLALQVEEQLGGLDVLVCNAGIHGPKGPIDEVDWDSWVEAIQINLLGTVLCCRLFLPMLRRSPHAKIILLSGGGATKPMPFLSAYAASKAAVVRFGETLAAELRPSGIDVNSVAPGAMNTRLLQDVIDAGPDRVGSVLHEALLKQKESGGTPFELGANLCLYLASDESDGITGRLISAVWDPWQRLHLHRENLDKTDVYTLRRIVPGERGLLLG